MPYLAQEVVTDPVAGYLKDPDSQPSFPWIVALEVAIVTLGTIRRVIALRAQVNCERCFADVSLRRVINT
jgi:hypothetical protein